jgi:hypothetical protein
MAPGVLPTSKTVNIVDMICTADYDHDKWHTRPALRESAPQLSDSNKNYVLSSQNGLHTKTD